MSLNVLGISEVPSEARNLDKAIAKSDTHLLADPKGEQRSCEEFRPEADLMLFIAISTPLS